MDIKLKNIFDKTEGEYNMKNVKLNMNRTWGRIEKDFAKTWELKSYNQGVKSLNFGGKIEVGVKKRVK
jgi:hypothetical protein